MSARKAWNQKLTPELADEIRKSYASNKRMTYAMVKKKYGISNSMIYRILHFKSHLPDDVETIFIPVPVKALNLLRNAAEEVGKPMEAYVLSCAIREAKRQLEKAVA